MINSDKHVLGVCKHYDELAVNGPYATSAPGNKGGRKGHYVSSVFDAALIPIIGASSHDRVLDFGCGTGIFTRQLASYSNEVVGTDISQRMLAQAKSHCQGLKNVLLMQTDGLKLDLSDASFDTIIAREVLCYLPDRELHLILSEFFRISKPGCHLLWLEQVSEQPYWQRHPKAPYLVKRSPDSVRSFAKKNGWTIESERLVRTPRFPLIYVAWSGLAPKAFIPKLAQWEVALHAESTRRPARWWNELFIMTKTSYE